jgi:hypothetical protein
VKNSVFLMEDEDIVRSFSLTEDVKERIDENVNNNLCSSCRDPGNH